MVDPEILDPEDARGSPAGASTAGVEHLVALVQRALPGRTVRVDVEPVDPARPRSPLAGGPRFRLEAEGKGGAITVESGPLFTTVVRFRHAQFAFNTMSGGEGVPADIAKKVRELADEELIVLEQQSTDRLLRTTVLRVDGGRIAALVDQGMEPHEGAPSAPRFHSFNGTWSRAPTKKEQSLVDKLGGGLMGKLRRKVAEKIFNAAAGQLKKSVENAVDNAVGTAVDDAARADDGRRRLK